MKKLLCVAITLSLALFMAAFSSCSIIESSPEDTIYKLQDAANDGDIEGMIECYEPRVQKMYSGLLTIGEELLGFDIGSVAEGLGAFSSLFGDELGAGYKCTITINDLTYTAEDQATANVTMSVYQEQAGLQEQTGDLVLVKVDGEWYISADTSNYLS